MVIKIFTYVAIMLSLLFGASCLFVAIAGSTDSRSEAHWFWYPHVFGGVTYCMFTILSLIIVLTQLPVQTKEFDRKENGFIVLLFYPFGLLSTLIASIWWGVFQNSASSVNFLPGVTPFIFMFPYFLTAIPFLYSIENFLNRDFYFVWKLVCGNKEVAIYGMVMSNLVLIILVSFFLGLLVLPAGIFVFQGMGLSLNLLFCFQLFGLLKSEKGEDGTAEPIFTASSAANQHEVL